MTSSAPAPARSRPAPTRSSAGQRTWSGLLDGLGIERAALVGHSVGCMVAERATLALARAGLGARALRRRPRLAGGRGPVFEERARLARAGRMDQMAEVVATTGLSERARREDPRLHGLMRALIAGNDRRAYAECSRSPPPRRRWRIWRASPARCWPSAGPRTRSPPPARRRRSRRRLPDGNLRGGPGRRPLVHARGSRGDQRGPLRFPRGRGARELRSPGYAANLALPSRSRYLQIST